MHVSKSGTFYDIYVKNSLFLDFSIDEYIDKVYVSIVLLKNILIGDMQTNVKQTLKNNEDTLLKTGSSSANLSSMLQSLKEEKDATK